jgi:hypothetical protein
MYYLFNTDKAPVHGLADIFKYISVAKSGLLWFNVRAQNHLQTT